jgi:hypothetical protein
MEMDVVLDYSHGSQEALGNWLWQRKFSGLLSLLTEGNPAQFCVPVRHGRIPPGCDETDGRGVLCCVHTPAGVERLKGESAAVRVFGV